MAYYNLDQSNVVHNDQQFYDPRQQQYNDRRINDMNDYQSHMTQSQRRQPHRSQRMMKPRFGGREIREDRYPYRTQPQCSTD